MKNIILFHGSSNKTIIPTFGLGEEKHDYGRGFYMTENAELAREWAGCKANEFTNKVHICKLYVCTLFFLTYGLFLGIMYDGLCYFDRLINRAKEKQPCYWHLM